MKKVEESTSKAQKFEGTMTIKELAEQVNLTPRSIRYYEEIGILGGISRDAYNRRRYSKRDVYFLRLLKRAKNLLGLNLKEIKELSLLFNYLDPKEKKIIKSSIKILNGHNKRITAKQEGLEVTKKILTDEIQRLESLLKGKTIL